MFYSQYIVSFKSENPLKMGCFWGELCQVLMYNHKTVIQVQEDPFRVQKTAHKKQVRGKKFEQADT